MRQRSQQLQSDLITVVIQINEEAINYETKQTDVIKRNNGSAKLQYDERNTSY